ncbi:MAG TPA: phosphatidylserine/phosphatidylglycerophosphate/cardiolipin synthase family protein [Burkholderiaceae bacterium]|nr:phosphatidylserine/phosphatidylglycerophosphate/cardiolipin synthase family protein [Burkholderiaceae bacterium]
MPAPTPIGRSLDERRHAIVDGRRPGGQRQDVLEWLAGLRSRWAATLRQWQQRHAASRQQWRDALAEPDPLERHRRALALSLDQPPMQGNRVDALPDARAAGIEMLDAIAIARDHINIEACLVETEGAGPELAKRLIAKRREGVKVNVLLDRSRCLPAFGGRLNELREAGVQMCRREPLPAASRKRAQSAPDPDLPLELLIVDGRIAFIGSMSCIRRALSASNMRWPETGQPWRDLHVRIQGPVVARLQELFIDHWCAQAGAHPRLARYFPPPKPAGVQDVGVASHSALGASLWHAIELSQDRVCVMAAGFAPPRRILHALCRAAQRGVAVSVVLSRPRDHRPSLRCAPYQGMLLGSGVRLFERRQTTPRTKAVVIDGAWAGVGLCGLERRRMSNEAEAEAEVVMVDADVASELENLFTDQLASAIEVTLPWNWRHRLQCALQSLGLRPGRR